MLFSKSTGLAIALAFAGAQNSAAKPVLNTRDDLLTSLCGPIGCPEGSTCTLGDMGVPMCSQVVDKRQDAPCVFDTDCAEGETCWSVEAKGKVCRSSPIVSDSRRRDTVHERQVPPGMCSSDEDCPEGSRCESIDMIGPTCVQDV